MYIIIEWNGPLPEGWIGEVLNESGEIRIWNTHTQARTWARRNCAFNFQVIKVE